MANTSDIEAEWASLPASSCPTKEPHLFETALSHPESNRYANILALEATRVRLSNNEYINANFVELIEDYKCIATQAPLPNTADNFWRMIMELDISVIVMLTRLQESGKAKANCYWPKASNSPFVSACTSFSVQLVREKQISQNTTLRTLEITENNTKKQVKHIHYMGWPDFGVPTSFREILKILKIVHDTPGIPLVHCSAGVGRAGTFLALLNFQKGQTNGMKLNVPEIIGTMRSQRAGAIQTKEQFQFIYNTINYEEKKTKKSALQLFFGRFF